MHLVKFSLTSFCRQCRILFRWLIIIFLMITICFSATDSLGFLKEGEEPFRTVFLFFLISSIILLRYAWVIKNEWPRNPSLAYLDRIACWSGFLVAVLFWGISVALEMSKIPFFQAILVLLSVVGISFASTVLYLGFIFLVAWRTRSLSRHLFDKEGL
jgi:hypothetical protein